MPAGKATGGPVLPVVTVARFEEAGRLVERMVDENADVFLSAAQRYRDRHAEHFRRELTPSEAVEVAAAMAVSIGGDSDPVELAALAQRSPLRVVDEPQPQELMMAAGVATAPALVGVARRLVALIELPPDVFEEACETGTLDERITEAADELRALALQDARARASRALEHFAKAAGASSGPEAWALVTGTVGRAFQEAMRQVAPALRSDSSSLTGSPPNTAGHDGPSSTTPPTATR